MPVDTSVYQNQPNPLGQISNVYGVLNAAQTNQLLQTATQQRQLELQSSYANGLYNTISPLVNSPGITQAQVRAAGANYARQVGMPPQAYDNFDQILSGPDWQTNLKNLAIRTTGPGNILSRTPTINLKSGMPMSTSAPGAIGQNLPTGVAPGFNELATGPAGAAGISNMAAVANDAPNQKAMLDNLAALGNEAVSGPSSDFEKRANALALRLFGKGVTLTPEQLASSEEYGKISEQLAGQQATAAHATNAFLTNAYNTNPSLYLSKIGRQGITHMLQGNVDSIVAKNNAWNAYANGETDGQIHSPAEFSTWNRQFNANFNPRVFQYAKMTPEERSKFRSTLPPSQQQQFYNQIQTYQNNGWINLTNGL